MRGMSSADPRDFLFANPAASRKDVMRACGCSARAVRRAQDQLALEAGGRGQVRILRALGGFAGLIGILGLLWAGTRGAAPAPPEAEPAAVDARARAAEAAIYSALNLRDGSRVAEFARHLESPDDALRLAALRYLTAADAESHLERLLPLVDDRSSRVRIAALQSLGGSVGLTPPTEQRLGERLVEVLLASERPASERLVAAQGLRRLRPLEPRRLLPALSDARLAAPVSEVLRQWTGKQVQTRDPSRLPAAWRAALEAS